MSHVEHCTHWYDGLPCCECGDDVPSALELQARCGCGGASRVTSCARCGARICFGRPGVWGGCVDAHRCGQTKEGE